MKKYLFILFIQIYPFSVMGQISFVDLKAEQEFLGEVSSISEFMERFNADSLTSCDRVLALTALINPEYLKTEINTSKNHIVPFINTVLQDSVRLRFEDSNWFAYAKCKIRHRNKESEMTLLLRTRQIEKMRYKWVICDVDAPELGLPAINSKAKISPSDNEINFMDLSEITDAEAGKNIALYLDDNRKIDKLSVFCSEVWNGQLHIEYVEELTYLFYAVKGFVFEVKNISNNTLPNGWLITAIKQNNEKQK